MGGVGDGHTAALTAFASSLQLCYTVPFASRKPRPPTRPVLSPITCSSISSPASPARGRWNPVLRDSCVGWGNSLEAASPLNRIQKAGHYCSHPAMAPKGEQNTPESLCSAWRTHRREEMRGSVETPHCSRAQAPSPHASQGLPGWAGLTHRSLQEGQSRELHIMA